MIALLASALLGASVVPVREAAIAGPRVDLGDVVDVSALPIWIRGRAAALQVAAFPPGQSRMILSSRRLAERGGALMPVLQPWLAGLADRDITVHRVPSASADASPGACVRLVRPVMTGAVPTDADLAPASCDQVGRSGRNAFRYDRQAGAVRAARDLRTDETIVAPPPSLLAQVAPGQRLHLSANVGAVAIQREVEAIQPGRPGQALFVRTEDGRVFSAPATELSQ